MQGIYETFATVSCEHGLHCGRSGAPDANIPNSCYDGHIPSYIASYIPSYETNRPIYPPGARLGDISHACLPEVHMLASPNSQRHQVHLLLHQCGCNPAYLYLMIAIVIHGMPPTQVCCYTLYSYPN